MQLTPGKWHLTLHFVSRAIGDVASLAREHPTVSDDLIRTLRPTLEMHPSKISAADLADLLAAVVDSNYHLEHEIS